MRLWLKSLAGVSLSMCGAAFGQMLNFEKIVEMGDPVPMTVPGGYVFQWALFRSNNNGDLTFRPFVRSSVDPNYREYWLFNITNDMLTPVVATPQAAPGTQPGVFFGRLDPIFLSNERSASGHTAFESTLDGPGIEPYNRNGLWIHDGVQTKLIARTGEQAASLPAGVLYGRDPTISPRPVSIAGMTDDGGVLYTSHLNGFGVTPGNDYAAWFHDGSQAQLILRKGDVAPGVQDRIRRFWQPTINGHGTLALTGSFTGITRDGIWHGTVGNLQPLAITETPAPGTSAGTIFDSFDLRSRVAGNGDIVFTASLKGPPITTLNDSAIYRGQPGDLEIVVREGEAVPGITGASYGLLTLQAFGTNGHVLFDSALKGVPEDRNRALFLDDSSSTTLIVQKGDPAPGGGVFRIIPFFPNSSHAQANALGQVVFGASTTLITDGVFGYDPTLGLMKIAAPGDDVQVAPGDVRTIEIVYLGDGPFFEHNLTTGLTDRGVVYLDVSYTDRSRGLFRTVVRCYPDCDPNGTLDIFDFLCFQNSFVRGEPYACDCDPDPVCDIFDFLCFQNAFVGGCP